MRLLAEAVFKSNPIIKLRALIRALSFVDSPTQHP
jgi:hypothetical protein